MRHHKHIKKLFDSVKGKRVYWSEWYGGAADSIYIPVETKLKKRWSGYFFEVEGYEYDLWEETENTKWIVLVDLDKELEKL